MNFSERWTLKKDVRTETEVLTLTRSIRLISSSRSVNCAAVTQCMQSTGLPKPWNPHVKIVKNEKLVDQQENIWPPFPSRTLHTLPSTSFRKWEATWSHYWACPHHVSIASCANRTFPNWQCTRALPNSSSISKVSGATLAQFLHPAHNCALVPSLPRQKWWVKEVATWRDDP